MSTVQEIMLEELIEQGKVIIAKIEEGKATPEQQQEVMNWTAAVEFHLNRYMLFDPVPLTTTNESNQL